MEVAIGSVLIAILLSVLFGFYRNFLFSKEKVFRKKELVLNRNLPRQILFPLLQDIPLPMPEKKIFSLYIDKFEDSNELALYFLTERAIDPNPEFCGLLKGAIYLDHDKELTLVLWPKKGEGRVLHLLENCKSMQWEFLDPATYEWVALWDKNSKELPLAIKLRVQEKNGSNLEYSFWIPKAQKPLQFGVGK